MKCRDCKVEMIDRDVQGIHIEVPTPRPRAGELTEKQRPQEAHIAAQVCPKCGDITFRVASSLRPWDPDRE
jgi:Zn finger protein HypA/HybF involved in hydrogenase expression